MHVRKLISAATLVLAFLSVGVAAQSLSPAKLDKLTKKYAQLQTKAARQQGHNLAETLSDMAVDDYTFANASFSAHDLPSAHQHLAAMTTHADKACALLQAEAKGGKKDGIKHVEKNIQRIAFGLRGIQQSVDFRQQAALQAAVDHFTNLNYELLQWLFAPKP